MITINSFKKNIPTNYSKTKHYTHKITHLDAIRDTEKLPQIVAQNIKRAKKRSKKRETLIPDKILPYPARFVHIVTDTCSAGYKFLNSLKINKDSLMCDLQIDKNTYDMLAGVALKIAHNESQLGASPKFRFYDMLESYDFIRNIASYIRKLLRGNGALSLGITQFKIANVPEAEKKLFKKYSITIDKDILVPEKSAVATLIHLSEMNKDYSKYLAKAKKIHPDTRKTKVKRAINNAKKILFNDDTRPYALKAMTRQLSIKEPKFYNLTAKDLEDLKVYASTVELSPEAYLAARWPNKAIIPDGERKNTACRNLLNIIAQKGYIANIDKSSKIIY